MSVGGGPAVHYHEKGCPTRGNFTGGLKCCLVHESAAMTLERLRYYAYDEREPVLVNETRGAELRIREIS
jgi:hypothetical protein